MLWRALEIEVGDHWKKRRLKISRRNQVYQLYSVQMEVASSRLDHLPTLSIAKSSEHSLLVKSPMVAERLMPALQLRLLLQCAGDIELNPGPVSTPTNRLRLMQWYTNGISGKITELRTFLHRNNVNIAAIQETKLTNKTKPLKTPGWAAV